MNAKPGEMCILLRATDPECHKFIGLVRKVIDPQGRYWRFDPPIFLGMQELIWADRDLRPIRDPGEDAQDETLQWLPVPGQKVPA